MSTPLLGGHPSSLSPNFYFPIFRNNRSGLTIIKNKDLVPNTIYQLLFSCHSYTFKLLAPRQELNQKRDEKSGIEDAIQKSVCDPKHL